LVALEAVLLAFANISTGRNSVQEQSLTADNKNPEKPFQPAHFMHLAWLANPLAYVAINTVIPLIPSISAHLGLTTAVAGIFCSVWMFIRLGAFFLLWRWTGWHYRFGWLAVSFIIMISCFIMLILAGSVQMLLIAQVGFGLATGLIYYSSLYYSMNASEKKGAHGGLHEAMIGAGLFLGPACGAGAFALMPSSANAGVWAVSGLLGLGFTAFLWIRKMRY
jgi:MFS family permease